MYYRYNDYCEIIEKSKTELTGKNVVTSSEDLDIELFRVIVGYIGEDRTMLRHTKFIRNEEMVSRKLSELQEQKSTSDIELKYRMALIELEMDYRLSLIELGLR